jgi:hypothetical protein
MAPAAPRAYLRSVSDAVFDELCRFVATKTDDPVHRARQRRALRALVDMVPAVKKEIVDDALVEDKRGALRRVIAVRHLPCSAGDEARIDACADLPTLRRWLDQAVVAASAAGSSRASWDRARAASSAARTARGLAIPAACCRRYSS